MTSNIRVGTLYWALTGIFAALHLVLTMIPLFVLTGGQGFISMGLVSSVVIGFVLGPIYGALSVLIGSGLGVLIFNIGGILGPFIPVVSPVVGAFVAGCLKTKQKGLVFSIYVIGIMGYLISPIGFILPIYIWMHTIAMILILLFFNPKTASWIYTKLRFEKSNPETSLAPLWLISFIALMGDNLIGATLGAYWFIYAIGLAPTELAGFFVGAILVYPFERIAVTLVVTAVLMTLGRAFSGTQLNFLLEETPKSLRLEPLHLDEAS
ncbi:hypothetical protein EU527_05820 [Candidatus Thorarchaeota archaeon]|nr:MAG: hypothetical protein EU527_05820 [Candidatus Thorarchaeota archaeon]